MSKAKFREVLHNGIELLAEGSDPRRGRRIRAIGAVADQVNLNRRLYPEPVLREAVDRSKENLHRSLGRGRYGLLGEADHPSGAPRFLETIVKWEAIDFNPTSKQVELVGRLLETRNGKDAIAMMEAGVLPGVSLRGYGESELDDELAADGEDPVERVTYLELTGFDLVFEQAFPDARVTVFEQTHQEEAPMSKETKAPPTNEPAADAPVTEAAAPAVGATAPPPAEAPPGEATVDPGLARELAEQRKQREAAQRELVAARDREQRLTAEMAALEEARQALEEAARRREVAETIERAAADLPYDGPMRESFVRAVKEAAAAATAPLSDEAIATLIDGKRREYDAVLAAARVEQMGGPATTGGRVEVRGPVFEQETGQPEFARVAIEFQEQMRYRGLSHGRDLRRGEDHGALLATKYLAAFDKAYRTQLLREAEAAREWQEALLTTDLNLPYSVSRTIIAEAVPQLVAANIFDVDTIETSPTRIMFEVFMGESGLGVAVTDESVTSSEDAYITLAHKRISGNSVTVTSDPVGTTYTEHEDYVIDYANGRLWTMTAARGGTIGDATPLLVSYSYNSVRAGENAAIQRGKATLAFKTVEVAADRLATLISDEALTFATSQLGWDAASRTVAMLIRELREQIDAGILRLAVAEAIKSGNSGGVWTAASDSYDDLVQKMGLAKVAVMNSYYTPYAFVMSLTNAERLSNWTGFKGDGFPDALLSAAGFQRMSVKGLPVFGSTAMPDDVIVVANRELVHHRVLGSRPMSLSGPHQATDGSGNLIPAQEWFVQEYNYTESLIPHKGGTVRVA